MEALRNPLISRLALVAFILVAVQADRELEGDCRWYAAGVGRLVLLEDNHRCWGFWMLLTFLYSFSYLLASFHEFLLDAYYMQGPVLVLDICQ